MSSASPRERDDAAAKAPANHARSQRTCADREPGELIELRRRDLVVVAQRTMRRVQELTELHVISGANGVDRSTHAPVLGDDVTNPPIEGRRQPLK